MNAHYSAGLWPEKITSENWAGHRQRIIDGVMKMLGPFPERISPLDPEVTSKTDCGSYVWWKVSIQVQPND